jgi:nicotinamide-nucleotide amidase
MSVAQPLRTAEIIAVGSEMLGSTRVDTNSLALAEQLESIGIELRAKAVVGDDLDDLASIFRHALERADLVVLTGGLGPTDDDLTRNAVADVLRLALHEDPDIVQRIRERFAGRGLTMPETNRRQALVPAGARVLPNPRGTAPGLLIEHGPKVIALLPGPPREMLPMFQELCAGPIGERAGVERIYRASLFVAGRGESHVEERVQPIYAPWRSASPPIQTTILAAPGQIELHLTTRDSDPAEGRARVLAARDALASALGEDVFSTNGDPMERIVGDLLRARGYTVAAAESCTGGLLMSRLTDIPGSSEYVRGGVVVYGYPEKVKLAGVSQELLDAYGAVSEPVAVAMAEGMRERTGADVTVGITGIAGPGGGTPEKPVGTVAVATLVPGAPAHVQTLHLLGNRSMIKFWSTQAALDRIRRLLTRG